LADFMVAPGLRYVGFESGDKKKPPGFGDWFGSSARCLRSDLSTAGEA
jgi:hypothetical protein